MMDRLQKRQSLSHRWRVDDLIQKSREISMSTPFLRRIPPPLFGQLKDLPDERLMEHLQAGHEDALAVLFDRYHRLVLSIALKIVKDPAEAEDVMQNVFLEIFRTAAQFDPARGNTKTWFLQYAYHRSLNRKRQLTVRHFYHQENGDDAETFMPPQANSVIGRFSSEEAKHLVRQGLASLNHQQRRVLELASFGGFSMNEIAEKTGDSLSNVRHYYYRGLKKMRALITGKEVGGNGHG
jgi:RNA polymerase sigma-70 factor, ECF subfamily